MSLREELEEIHRQHDRLTPELVVQAAAATAHPLHHRFEWNDTEAGRRYRLFQASDLIRSVRVVYATSEGGEEKTVRRFVAPAERERPHEYVPTEVALADAFTRQLILRQFERAVIAMKRQYGHLKEYDRVIRQQGLSESQEAS